MEVKIEVRGLDAAVSKLDKMSISARNGLKSAMKDSLEDIQQEARAHHRFTTRTGEAERSIQTDASYRQDDFRGVVGTTRKITIFLHQGTQPHVIRPRSKMALRWSNGSKFIFAKRSYHPGTKKDPFIYNAVWRKKSSIQSRFQRAIRAAIGEMT